MNFFEQQTQVIRLDDANTVTIRRLTFGESQQVLSESIVFNVITLESSFDFARNQASKLERAIVSWEGPGFDGRPVTPENIAALSPEIGQRIMKAVDALNEGLTDTEQKN